MRFILLVRKETIEKLREFAIEEGVLGRKLPKKQGVDAVYEINFPPNSPRPQKIILIFPKDQNVGVLQLGVQASPQHATAFRKLSQERQVNFFIELRKLFHLQNVLFSINHQNLQWLISDVMYEGPELTKNFLFDKLWRIFNIFMYVNILLDEYCGSSLKAGLPKDGTGTDSDRDFTGTSLYM